MPELERAELDRIRKEERDRVAEITGLCTRFGFEASAKKLIDQGSTVDDARQVVIKLLERTAESQPTVSFRPQQDPYYNPQFRVGRDETEKKADAMVDGLCLRAGIPLKQPAPGARDFRAISLVDVARQCLSGLGSRVAGMSKTQVVKEALSQRAAMTSDFPYLLANVANKSLRVSYDEAPGSFELWVNQTDGTDFKEISRTQLSEAPGLDAIPEGMEYKYGKFGESKEVFSIIKYGKLFSITREAIINDDLGAFTRVPRAFAMAAKRKVNALVYGILTSNAAMADGKALFHADHNNLVASGSGSVPGLLALSGARLAIRRQTGLNGAVLNIAPAFLIVPAALETACDEILNSVASTDDNKNSGVINPFYRKLELVVDSALDDVSSKAWYVAANPKHVDTVELCFLDGRRAPYLETREGWTVDGVEYKARIEFGVKAIDWRGLYKNAGE